MKRSYIILLGVIIVGVAAFFVLTSLRLRNDFRFERSAEEMHAILLEQDHYLEPGEAAKLIEKQGADFVFVDIRNPEAYAEYHIEGSVNIPMQTVLNRENLEFLEGSATAVLVDHNGIDANQLWLLLSQYGLDNLLVLAGGIDYWTAFLQGADDEARSFDDEAAQFDYDALVDEVPETIETPNEGGAVPNPPVQRRERKMVQGGCS